MKALLVRVGSKEDLDRLQEALGPGAEGAMGMEASLDRIRTSAADVPMIYTEAEILDPMMGGFEAAVRDYVEGVPLPTIIMAATEQLQRSVAGTMSAFMTGVIMFVNAVSVMEHDEAMAAKTSAPAEEYTIIDDLVRCACGDPRCGKRADVVTFSGMVGLGIGAPGRGGEEIVLGADGARNLARLLLEAAQAVDR